MPHVIATERPLWWAVTENDAVIATGVTEVGALTVTGEDKALLADSTEIAFLAQVAGKASGYNPLPETGWLEAGEMYSYSDTLVIVRQSHFRTEHTPGEVPALFIVYREDADEALTWVAGEQVYVATLRLYNGVLYECLQAHVTQGDWPPDATPALWREVVETPEAGPQPWVQPSGAHDAYQKGDRVTHNGKTWESTLNANIWEPGVFGWVEV